MEYDTQFPPLASACMLSSHTCLYYMHIIHIHEHFLLPPNSALYQLMSGSPYQDMGVLVAFKLLLWNALDIIVESWPKITTSSVRHGVCLVLIWVFSWAEWGISSLLYNIQLMYLGNCKNKQLITIYLAYGGLPSTSFKQFLSKHILQASPLETHSKTLVC